MPDGDEASSGGLKQLLIDTGLQILAEDGLDKLTLRKVAARAGVTHAAPAYHFKGLPDLLGHMCAVGFEDLRRCTEGAVNRAGHDPHAQLNALCEGYVAFASSNPGLVQLMFSNRKSIVDDTPLRPAAKRAYAVLQKACAPFEPVGDAPDSTETMIWSLVHGFVFLSLGERFANPYRVTPDPELSDILPKMTLRKTA